MLVKPDPAPQTQIVTIKNQVVINNTFVVNPIIPPSGILPPSPIAQWQPDWVRYDLYYRPVIFNPYPNPLRVVYTYAGAPRILLIPALASIVTEAAIAGAYNFTAMGLDAAGAATSVAVGSFFGGGYLPAPGQLPPVPAPVTTIDNVPVVVKYANAQFKPFVVQKLVDVGDDPQFGEHKVLLDGVTPAWGKWTQGEGGAQQFEVHKTQQFPGLDDPGQTALPGNYQLQLAGASHPMSGFSTKDVLIIGGAAVLATLGIGAIVLNIFLGRRRRSERQPEH